MNSITIATLHAMAVDQHVEVERQNCVRAAGHSDSTTKGWSWRQPLPRPDVPAPPTVYLDVSGRTLWREK